METITTFENNFKYDNSKKYSLILQGGSNAITYAIYEITEKKYIGLKHLPFSLSENEINEHVKKIIEQDTLLSYNFSEVFFQHQSFRAMLVPESLFDSKNLRAFLKFHYDVDEKDYIHFQEIKSAEAFVIFTIPVQLEEFLTKKYNQVKFSHHAIPFIYNAVNRTGGNDNLPNLCINFSADFFDIMIIRNSKIQLFNSFFYKKYTDVLFFIANILNLFSLKPDKTKIYISGYIEEISEMKKELEKIFKTIIFEKFNPDYNYDEHISALEQHRFANLLNLYSCEL